MNPNTRGQMGLPPDLSLPLFVYGALKPGMPAHQALRPFLLGTPQRDRVAGEIYVRDALPLLILSPDTRTDGFILTWQSGMEREAYDLVCAFEPREHYAWTTTSLDSGLAANVMIARYPTKGHPEPLGSSQWSLVDDPAFGEGLKVIRSVIQDSLGNPEWSVWEKFFRAQMAYLLLWSVLERLAALCFGPGRDPTERVSRLHQLPGMAELVREVVHRTDRVTDSRDPSSAVTLDAENAKKSFDYYYQVRSNLSHRGKAVHTDVDRVQGSLEELLQITERFLDGLRKETL